MTFLVSLSLPQVRDVHHPGNSIFFGFMNIAGWILVLNVFHISWMIWRFYLNPDLPLLVLSFISPFSSIHCFYFFVCLAFLFCFVFLFLSSVSSFPGSFISNFSWNILYDPSNLNLSVIYLEHFSRSLWIDMCFQK